MKKMISLLVVVITMTLGFSSPTFAAPDFGTENQFTIEQATLDMDITIDVTMDFMPATEFELSPEPIYLEGTVIIYPHMEEGYMFKIDQTALSQNGTQYTHDDNLCSMGTMENLNNYDQRHISWVEPAKEGPMRLELYSIYATWRYQETYS